MQRQQTTLSAALAANLTAHPAAPKGAPERIDVLAVLDAEISAAMDACKSAHGSPRLGALYATRAAVADLIEKAEKLARNDFTLTSGTAYVDAQALRVALASMQGGAS